MCEDKNLFVFGTMELFCSHCIKKYKIEFDERKTPFEARIFYLVPISKSIYSENRDSVMQECVRIPTLNFEDPKKEEVLE